MPGGIRAPRQPSRVARRGSRGLTPEAAPGPAGWRLRRPDARRTFAALPALDDLHENLRRTLALLARDVEMTHRPHDARTEGEDEHAALLGAGHHRGGIGCIGSEAEDEDVGLRRGKV